MHCSNCGTANESSNKFCAECGARLTLTCPGCGLASAATVKFCPECGTSLAGMTTQAGAAGTGSGPGPAQAAGRSRDVAGAALHGSALHGSALPGPAAERRLVSVLFADLVGFTSLSESRDPEAVRELLTRYFDVARDVIGRYGGTVEKFIGDAVMAIWGAPVAREDDAERAVRAGIELVDAVRALGTGIGHPGLAARAGVTTGEAAVTLGAQGQGMVAGDIVNTASRLQAIAAPNTVVVGETTYRAASGGVAFEQIDDQALKGKTSAVPAWRALRVVAQRGGAGRAKQLEAPFVGRDDEFRLLKELLHATSREGRARLVSIMGQAGIGKSRLAWEFLKYIDGLVEDVYWHEGRSLAYGQGISYWALGEMVRSRAGISEADDPSTSRAKLEAAVAQYVPDVADRRWVEPRLAALLGLDEAPSGQREELFAAWRTLFERIAARGTTVLVFEDLQWADAGLLDFIDHLLEWSRAHPILIVTLARQELLDRRPDWGAGRRSFVSLALEPLSPAAMRQLLAGLVPGLPEPAVAAILARAEGIPLYAVETVRMLLDDHRLEEADGAYRPVGELSSLAVPESLHALIAARLDALDPADRILLQAAAVLGQTFTVPALAAVSGEAADALESRLRALVRREMLALNADPRSPERGQYGFTQAVIREVAYSTLSKRDRRARHLAAARYFEGQGDEELAGVLASHYAAAYRAAPEGPEGDAIAVQARLALRGAAERAGALHDYEGALAYLAEARDVAADPAERAAIDERAAEFADTAGQHSLAESHIDRAIEWHRSQGDRLAAARASTRRGRILVDSFRPDEAIPTLEQALAEIGDAQPDADMAATMAQLARAYMASGDTPRGLEWSDRAIVLAERTNALPVIVDALITRAWAVGTSSRAREATATLRGALYLAQRHGLVVPELRARHNLTSGYEDDMEEIRRLIAGGLELARKHGIRPWASVLLGDELWWKFFAGDWDALPNVAEAEEADFQLQLSSLQIRAMVDAYRGQFDLARATIQRASSILVGTSKANDLAGNRVNTDLIEGLAGNLEAAYADLAAAANASAEIALFAWYYAGRFATWLGDVDRLDACLRGIEVIGAPDRWSQAMVATLAGARAGLGGRADEARSSYREALRLWADVGSRADRALAQVDWAVLLGDRDEEARQAGDEARSELTALRMAPSLTRLDAARRATVIP